MAAESSKAWRCKVCGYVHRGDEPPEWCPLCGASSDEFELLQEDVQAASSQPPPAPAERFSCLNCNYVHQGESAPEICPVCGASADRFEPLGPQVPGQGLTDEGLAIVVVGAGIAGLSTVEAILENAPQARVTLLSKEDALPYYRLNLTRYLAGEVGLDDLPIKPAQWYQDKGVDLRLAAEISSLDLAHRRVSLHGGQSLPFDRLILAAGAHPFIPPFAGIARDCVRSLRTIDDARCLLDASRDGGGYLCVGGGVLGLEAAGALVKQGCPVDVFEGFGWLLPRQLNERAARILERHVEGLGIRLHLNAKIKGVVGDERARGLEMEDGQLFDGDQVVITTGVRPNSYLARRAGLKVKQGVIVDGHMQTSHPHVYAAGDVAEHDGRLYGIWAPAMYQGKIAGLNAVGGQSEFGGLPPSNTLKVLGLDLFSIGLVNPDDASYTVVEYEQDETFYRLVFRDSVMKGAVLLGDSGPTSLVKQAIEDRTDFSGMLSRNPDAFELLQELAS